MCLLFGLVRLTDLTEFVRGIVVHRKDFAVRERRTWVLEDPTGTPVSVARVLSSKAPAAERPAPVEEVGAAARAARAALRDQLRAGPRYRCAVGSLRDVELHLETKSLTWFFSRSLIATPSDRLSSAMR